MFSNMLRYDKSCSTLCWAIFWMACFGLHLAKGQMAAPTTRNILETSFDIVFAPFTGAEKYHAIVRRKHSSISRTICVTSSGSTIANLTGDTLYSVTIKPVFSDGTDGAESPKTEFRTLPGSPSLYFNEILPNSVLIFFELPNYAAVSQYSVRYRIQGGDGNIQTVDTLEDIYYVYRLPGLVADTTYEVSARALRLSGSTNKFTEAQTPFSPWQTVKTDSLSVFGRVNFHNDTYNSNYAVEYSTEWNNTLSSIKNAYDASLYNSINIVRVENIGNIPRVHYQLKMKEKNFSGDASTYIITGTNFDNSLVNYGDKATGTVFIGETTSSGTHDIRFAYGQGTRCTENYRENHVLISPDNSTTLIYRINDLSSDSTAQGSAFLRVTEIDGVTKLVNAGGFVFHTFDSHTVFGLTPKYLLQDCLKNQAESLFSLYHDADQVIGGQEPPARLYSTEFVTSTLTTMGEALYNFSSDGTTANLYVPAVKKAIKYTVLNSAGDSTLGEIQASDIDGSDYQKISLESLTNGITYTIKIRVTARQHDDDEVTADSDLYTFTTSGNQCSVCDSNAICFTERFSNSPTCQCNAGFTGNGATCTQINYCDPSPCHVNATCDEEVVTCEGDATHSCKCKDGFSGDGTSCTDVAECDTNNGGCHENATCTNSIGSFSCECKNGFSGDGTSCTDVVECDRNNGGCHENATCTNTIGSFICKCKNGFSGDGTSCTDVVECDTNNGGCHENASCTNTIGSFSCKCKNGFSGDGTSCRPTDVVECDTNDGGCHENASCTNTTVSFSCECKNGFSGDGTSCADVVECDTNNGGCHENASCTNTIGSFSCECKNGFSGDGTSCTDVVECDTNNGGCHENATCTNTIGSFSCECKNGFSGDGKLCTDVIECDTNHGDCHENATCTNTIGSFSCECKNGFSGDGTSCTDTNNGGCHENARCINTIILVFIIMRNHFF